MSDEHKFVDVSGHVVTDVEFTANGPVGTCPEYKHRVYVTEVKT